MKELNDMVHAEIVALSSDEIDRLCDYECARNGVKLMTFPKEPAKRTFIPDAEVFEVAGYTSEDRSVIEKIATFLADVRPQLCKVEYDYKVGSDYKYITRNLSDWDHKSEIKKVSAFNAETYSQMKNSLQQYSTEMSEYQGAKKSYDENKTKREKTCKWMTDKIYAHKALEKKVEHHQSTMAKYLELAGGNKDIAANFFEKSLEESERNAIASYLKIRILFPEDVTDELLDQAVEYGINYL